MKCNFASFISGNSLPHPLEGAAVIEHEDSFMILGGNGNGGDSDKIYKYNKDGGQWVEVPAVLSEGKHHLTAIKVKSSIFNPC